jgi:uncharacterized protein (DUF488 family)
LTSTVFTIGHSNRSVDKFLELLSLNQITAVADVRSHPVSRLNPQYNREALVETLKTNGIAYVFLGRELGARPKDPTCYVEGKVQYERLGSLPQFWLGLSRIASGAQQYRVAVMCAERDPLTCHRSILIARHLISRGVKVRHIITDEIVEDHFATMERLVRLLRLETDMFTTVDDLVERAYALQGAKISFDRSEVKFRRSQAGTRAK